MAQQRCFRKQRPVQLQSLRTDVSVKRFQKRFKDSLCFPLPPVEKLAIREARADPPGQTQAIPIESLQLESLK